MIVVAPGNCFHGSLDVCSFLLDNLTAKAKNLIWALVIGDLLDVLCRGFDLVELSPQFNDFLP